MWAPLQMSLCRLQYIDDTYSRLAKGEVDPMDELGETVRDVQVDTNHRFNSLGAPPDRSLRVATAVGLWLSHGCAEYEMKEMEARIMDAIAGKRKSKKQSTDLSDGAE